MMFIKKNLASSLLGIVTLLGAQFAFSGQAHAWAYHNGNFRVCNNMNGAVRVKKTHQYQMKTRDDDSANQVIHAHSCEHIRFSAQWKMNSDDSDDAMDFDVIHNGETVGNFTIKVVGADGISLIVGLRKGYSHFVKLKTNAIIPDVTMGRIEFND